MSPQRNRDHKGYTEKFTLGSNYFGRVGSAETVMTEEADLEIDERVHQTLARIFDLPISEASNLRMGLHPRWDSIGHMQLIMEIEKEFGLRFPTYEIAELLSTDAIVKAVERHTQK